MRRYARRRQNAFGSGAVWPDTGGSASAGVAAISDVFGPRPFAAHIPTVGYDYDFHRGIDIDVAEGDPVYSPITGAVNRWHFSHFDFTDNSHLERFTEVDPGSRATWNRVGNALRVVGVRDGVKTFPTNCPYLTLGKRIDVNQEWAFELRCGQLQPQRGAIGVAVINFALNRYIALEYDGTNLRTLGRGTNGFLSSWDKLSRTQGNVTEIRLAHPDGAGTIEASENVSDTGLSVFRSRANGVFTNAYMDAIVYYRSNDVPGTPTPEFDIEFVNLVDSQTIGRFGNWMQITDGSRRVAVMHLREPTVSRGQIVQAGDQIGVAGKTGFDGRSGRIQSVHAHMELIQDSNFFYFNDEPVNPLKPTFLPRTNSDANVSVTVNESDTDPDSVASISLDISVSREGTNHDFDLNEVQLVGSSATRTVNFNTRAGLNADNDVPLEAGVYIEAFSFNGASSAFRVKFYFHSSVVGTLTSYTIRDTEGTVLASG